MSGWPPICRPTLLAGDALLARDALLAAAVLVGRHALGRHPLSRRGLRRHRQRCVGLRGHRLAWHALLAARHALLVTQALARHGLLPGSAGRGRRDPAEACLARDAAHGLLAGQRLPWAGLAGTGLARHPLLARHGLLAVPARLRRPARLALARTGVSLRLGNARLRLQS